MPLEPVSHTRTRIIDVDGTVIKKKRPEEYFTAPTLVLENAIETVNEWFAQGDYIVFWTARPKIYHKRTLEMLDLLGFNFHELICGKPYCHEIHIYDDNPFVFHQVERDKGIGMLKEDMETLYKKQATEIRRLRKLLEAQNE